MDLSTFAGAIIGLLAILLGNLLEGGHFGSLIQFTAALIVFGGTLGATMVANTASDLRSGWRLLRLGLSQDDASDRERLYQTILEAARVARQESLLALESRVSQLSDGFVKKVFRLAIDGVDPRLIREIAAGDIEREEERLIAGAKVWSDAGGFAPTIGILGAVLGLIHVMGNLTNTSELGKGIAVAFVATIYGVGSANLFFLPLASKLKRKISRQTQSKWMLVDGVIAMTAGMNPVLIQEKIKSYLPVEHSGQTEP